MRKITIQQILEDTFLPKLPHQNDFILNLYNDNYSIETIYNYNRDLSFFALFLLESHKNFKEIDKLTITYQEENKNFSDN